MQISESQMLSEMPNPEKGPVINPISFSTTWEILGPFQLGTREASWGADPLEFDGYDGFRSQEYDEKSVYHSSLAPNGLARWSIVETADQSPTAALEVEFPEVNWQFLQSVYGWAGLQYQAWARGDILVTGDEVQHVVLYTDYVLEFWLDGDHYFGGDFYAFRKAPPVLHLTPGEHRVDLRLIRDVRAMGGVGTPKIEVNLELQSSSGELELAKDGILLADVVDGKLASPWASVTVRNSGDRYINIVDVADANVESPITIALGTSKLTISPGQTRPIRLKWDFTGSKLPQRVDIDLFYHTLDQPTFHSSIRASQDVQSQSIYDPHKITFLHPGGTVSYAILRPPSPNSTSSDSEPAPVLLHLHGAGLEADSRLVAHALDPLPDLRAWVVFPTGVTPWCGDDWHTWGFADVEAAIASVPEWIEQTDWKGSGVDVDQWLVSGHSNGGQGAWYALTHRPDKLIGAAPVSGYLSIQSYVPYQLWSPMDPRRQAVLHGAMASYQHELLAENAQGIPIHQQHGSDDDNVPAIHSRLMAQRLIQASAGTQYVELHGKGHWFHGVMTTGGLSQFYSNVLNGKLRPFQLQKFTVVTANPAETGFKHGVRIMLLEKPGQYGKVHIYVDDVAHAWRFEPENVRAFQLRLAKLEPRRLVVDGQLLSDIPNQDGVMIRRVRRQATYEWKWTLERETTIHHHGIMNSLLSTDGSFTIVRETPGPWPATVALQISRNLFQYFSADSAIVDRQAEAEYFGPGNVIRVSMADKMPRAGDFPIWTPQVNAVAVRDRAGDIRTYSRPDGFGAIFACADVAGKLEVVVWGSNSARLAQAARLLPLQTGVGQPDFVILTKEALWKGTEGAVAMGFFDKESWEISETSFLS